MGRKLQYKKLPATYEPGFFDYSEYAYTLDALPEWPDYKEAGYTWDEHLKFMKFISIERLKYVLLNEELTEDEIKEGELIVEKRIKEYDDM